MTSKPRPRTEAAAGDPAPRARTRSSARADGEGLGARRLAFLVISEVLRSRKPLDDVFARALSQTKPVLAPRDAALARAICVTAFRRLGTIRAALSARMTGRPAKGQLRDLLTVIAAQVLFLDVPDHAAVATGVEVSRAHPDLKHYAKLVNALGRRLAREREEILAQAGPLDDIPEWLRTRWSEHFGEEETIALAAMLRREAPLDLTLRDESDAGARVQWAEKLDARVLPTGSLRLADRRAVETLPGYSEGAWLVQDAAAAIPARLLAIRPDERVADLCAAPGGKTAQLAARGGRVLAVDRSEKRLERVSENLQRLRLDAEIRAADVLALEDDLRFDAILLDAPCSATGTMRRHPDVAWTKTLEDVAKLADLQRRLIDKAIGLLAPGGRLVYCTCSLEPEEGEMQARALLKRHPGMERMPITPQDIAITGATTEDSAGLAGLIDAHGDFRALPHRGGPGLAEGLDGFFAARFVKRAG
jgi:16S rRNA (cytosine967-C5)-methyltransferase